MSQCRVGETHRPPGGHRSHRSVRAHVREKWRSTADSRGRSRLDAAGLHGRKVWQTAGLRSSAVGSGHGENGALALEKLARHDGGSHGEMAGSTIDTLAENSLWATQPHKAHSMR